MLLYALLNTCSLTMFSNRLLDIPYTHEIQINPKTMVHHAKTIQFRVIMQSMIDK